jgi:hypothetical protein
MHIQTPLVQKDFSSRELSLYQKMAGCTAFVGEKRGKSRRPMPDSGLKTQI